MWDAKINRNVKKADRVNQHHSWSIPTLSILLPIKRFINHQFTPPFTKFNICNNLFFNEQAAASSGRQSFFAPARSLFHMENGWAILFAEGGIFPPNIY